MSWLWKGDASSPASFEKALSKLSTQITAANLSLESTRSRSRRLKALWTIYTTLTYLVFLLILVLVIGFQNWSLLHYGGLIGAPLTIYGVRVLITSLSEWRAGRQQAHLSSLQKQREAKIADLKKATKYDSTQELLQKYGGAPSPRETPTKQSPTAVKTKSKTPAEPIQRTGIAPPPTANIPSRRPPQNPNTQPPSTPPPRSNSRASISNGSLLPQSPVVTEEPGFAPNAFGEQPSSRSSHEQSPHWYDRILDVLLGEDEHLAKNRLVLLCQNCRLVNGQAPPGVKTLEEIGKWRCGSCGAMNGTDSEAMKMVREMIERPKAQAPEDRQPGSRGDDETIEVDAMESEESTSHDRDASKVSDQDSKVTKRITRSSAQAE